MTPANLTDQEILNDMLMTEKYVSDHYNSGVLETATPEVRSALQHIQQEEQDHAGQIYDAMYQRGWHPVEPAK